MKAMNDHEIKHSMSCSYMHSHQDTSKLCSCPSSNYKMIFIDNPRTKAQFDEQLSTLVLATSLYYCSFEGDLFLLQF